MKAWLVTWKGSSERVERNGEIVSILDPSLGLETVRKHVERLYADNCYSLGERLDAARSGPNKHIPYPAQPVYKKISIGGKPAPLCTGAITCGHNPYLLARKVTDLEVLCDKDGNESLHWKELPIPDPRVG